MLRSLLSLGRSPDYLFPQVDPAHDGPDCLKDCADCTTQFPDKVKIETLRPLYGQIKGFHSHVLVATGRSDWKEKVGQEKGSLMEAFEESSAKSKLGVRIPTLHRHSIANKTPPAHHGLSVKHPIPRPLRGQLKAHNSTHSPIIHLRRLCITSRRPRPGQPLH